MHTGESQSYLVKMQKNSLGVWKRVLEYSYSPSYAERLGYNSNKYKYYPYISAAPYPTHVDFDVDTWLNRKNIQPIGYLTEEATEENHSGAQGTLAAHLYGFKNNTELKKGWEIGSFSIEKENGEPVQKEYIFEIIPSSELFSVSPEGMLRMKKRLDLQQKSKWNFRVSYSSDEEKGKAIVNLNVEGNLSRPLQVSVDMMELVERGLPVYDFSADQAFELSGDNEYIVTPAGFYIVEDVTRFSGETVTQMVQVQKDSAGNWQRVKDTYTGLEAKFLVLINYDDWFDKQNIQPIGYLFETVESLVQKTKGSKVQLLGKTLANGGSEITSYGFIWSDNQTFKNSHAVRGTLLLDYQQEMIFEANVSDVLSDTLYYKAFVENAEGLNFGAPKLIELEGIESPWWNKFPVLSGDWRSSWLGDFHPYDNGWIYHLQLGWTYVVTDSQDGLWLWLRNYGWLWTKEGVWPYLWQHNKREWFYLISGKGSSPLLYQHSTKTWEKLK